MERQLKTVGKNKLIQIDVKNVLGRGAYGKVIFGRFKEKDVAVKKLDSLYAKVIEKEKNLLVTFQHPNVIEYLFHDVDDEYHYIVLQLCSGTLNDYIKDPPKYHEKLPVSQVMLQSALGLEFLHSKGILHRDITLGNILLHERLSAYQVKISDFGISKELPLDRTSITASTSGTWAYMASEVHNKERERPSSDIFSLGIVFFELLSGGEHPFGNNKVDIPSNICKRQKPNLEPLKGHHHDLISSMLNHTASKRPSAECIVELLRKCSLRQHSEKASNSALEQEKAQDNSLKQSGATTRTKYSLQLQAQANPENASMITKQPKWKAGQYGNKNFSSTQNDAQQPTSKGSQSRESVHTLKQGVQNFLDSELREMDFGGQTYNLKIRDQEGVADMMEMSENYNDFTSNTKASDDDVWRRKLYITDIPSHLLPRVAFRYHFQRYGHILRCFMERNGRFGYIQYSDHNDACIAKEKARDGPGSKLYIAWARDERKPDDLPQRGQGQRSRRRSSNQVRVESKESKNEEPRSSLKKNRATAAEKGLVQPVVDKNLFDIVHYWSSFDVLPAPEGTRCLLVQNFEQSTHAETVKMHFENKKRSNGGPVETIVRMVDGLLVVFKNQEDCLSALGKEDQQFAGKDISIFPKEIPTFCDNKFVITGMGENTSVGALTLFLENCSESEATPITCEKQSLPGVYLIEYGQDYDPDESKSLLKKIATKPLEHQTLKAQKLLKTDCLKVIGVPQEASNDAIKLIFESKKRSDGGPVTRIERLKGNAALVYFAHFTDAERIYEKFKPANGDKIKVQDHAVTLQLYFHCLANDHMDIQLVAEKKPEAAKEVELPQKGPLMTFRFEPEKKIEKVITFIRQNKKHNDKMKMYLSHLASVAMESTLDLNKGRSSMFMSFTPLKKGKPFLNQKEFNAECEKGVLDFLSNYASKSYKLDRAKLRKVRSLGIFHILAPTFKGKFKTGDVEICWNANDDSTVEVTGAEQDIDSTIEYINERLNCTKIKMTINEDQYRIMTGCGIVDELKAMYGNVIISCEPNTQSITLIGLQADIHIVQIDALTILNTVEKKKLTGLKEDVAIFLSDTLRASSDMKGYIQKEMEKKNIKAMVKMDGDGPCIQMRSEKNFKKAIDLLKGLIQTDMIDIDEPTAIVVSSPSWTHFQQGLQGSWLYRIYVKPNDCILLVGLASELRRLKNITEDFLNENAVRQVIQMDYGQARFIVEQSPNFTRENCEKKSIECGLTSDRGGGIFVKGKRRSLNDAVSEMNNLHAKVIEQKHTMREPGMKEYFQGEYGASFLSTTERMTECVILVSSRECKEWVQVTRQQLASNENGVTPKPSARGQKLTSVKLPNAPVTLTVWKSDIISHKCDVMVHASNPELLLLSQGVSGVIKGLDDRNGRKIQTEMTAIIRKSYGNVLTGDAYLTTAGNMPSCKKIVHAIGPRWNSHSKKVDPKLVLKACVNKSLVAVDKAKFKSIAIPAISCGVFGGKVKVCIPLILEAVIEYFLEIKNTTINQVDFVEISNQEVLDEFTRCINNYMQSDSRPIPAASPQPVRTGSNPSSSSSISVSLKQGNIENQTADVIVNVTSPQNFVNMQGSAVSKAILQKAGLSILQECAQTPGPHNLGQVFDTSGGGLACKRLYHVIVSNYHHLNSNSVIKSVVKKSLQMADAAGYSTIVFPAIGTGGFNHPPKDVASWMRETISNFSSSNLNSVTIVLYPQNAAAIQAFNAEFTSAPIRSSGATYNSNSAQQTESSSLPSYGPFSVSVYQGDITREQSDVIVNGTNSNYDLSQGFVSHAIMNQGGAGIQNELNRAIGTDFRVTSGGNLQCSHIIHIIVPNDLKKLQNTILDILNEVENLGFSSVSIPALVTGNLGHGSKEVAGIMRMSFEKYARRNTNPTTLSSINVVIFDIAMLSTFKDVITKAQPASKSGFLSNMFGNIRDTFRDFFSPSSYSEPEEQEEILNMFFYSTKEENISKALKYIDDETRKVTSKQFKVNDDVIARITDWEAWEIAKVGRDNNVKITDRSHRYLNQITIEGLTSNVLKATETVKDILKDFSVAETTASFVTWQKDIGKDKWVDYSPRAIHILEKAYKKRSGNNTDKSLNIVDVPEYCQGVVTKKQVDLTNLDTSIATVRRKVKEKTEADGELRP